MQQEKKKKTQQHIYNKKLGLMHFQWTQHRWFNSLPIKPSSQQSMPSKKKHALLQESSGVSACYTKYIELLQKHKQDKSLQRKTQNKRKEVLRNFSPFDILEIPLPKHLNFTKTPQFSVQTCTQYQK